MSLAPCPSCSRHVRGSDASCPFCAEPAPLVPASAVDAAPAVGTRAHIFLGALTVAAGSRMRGQVEFGWDEKLGKTQGETRGLGSGT